MPAALCVGNFRLLWVARTISLLGSWLLVVAVPAYVLQLSGSLVATGLTLAAEFLAPVLLGPVAGVLVDRWDRRHVMLISDVCRAVAIGLLLFAREPGDLWIVYLALFVESVGTVLFRPAAQAHTPAVVGTGSLLSSANSLNALTDGTVRLVGAPLGGVLFGLAGFTTLVWVDVASYLVSGAAILMTTRLPSGRLERGGGIRVVLAELGEGMTFLRGERTASALLLVTTLFLAGNASLTALLVPFGVRELGGSVQTGLVMSALGVGFLLGAPVIRILVDRVQPGYLLCASLTATAIGFLLLFASRSMLSAVLAAVVIGVFGSMALVTAQTTVQRVTPNEVLGRISAAFFTGEAIATFLGALAGPAIAQSSSLAAAAYVACAATLLSGVLSLVLVPRRPTLSQTAEPPVDGGHRSRKGGCLAAVGS